MHKLIYKDIRDAQIQKEILQYIYQQAKVQAAHNQIGHLPNYLITYSKTPIRI